MMNEVKSAGVPRVIASVVLLLAGGITLNLNVFGFIISLITAGRNDWGFWVGALLVTIAGIVMVWGGVALWVRWRLPLAVIMLLMSLYLIFGLVARSGTTLPENVDARWATMVNIASIAIAVVDALTGAALFFIERLRRNKAGSLRNEEPRLA